MSARNQIDPITVSASCTKRWQQLSEKYLPVIVNESIWRYSRPHKDGDIRQGWKIHIAATILSAVETLEAVGKFLHDHDVLFKAPVSLDELQKLNAGLYYGYCQVGKFITVYPRSPQEARSLAPSLHVLTRGIPAPAVPFDQRFRARSSVFYRYGGFDSLTVENSNGLSVPAIRGPLGDLVPDNRYSNTAQPHWVTPLFANKSIRTGTTNNLLATTYRPFESLVQRGKGGVYKAFDVSTDPPRLCLIKEGRHCGETSWDATDGAGLVKHEEKVMRSLARAGIPVPTFLRSFQVNRNQYLVTEFIKGDSLHDILSKRQRRLKIDRVKMYALQLASLIVRIHDAGWAWRDCKPGNLIVTKHDVLRPIDFEGATPIHSSDSRAWSTRGFTPTETLATSGRLADIYAFGAVIYYLLTGELPQDSPKVAVEKLRPKVPEELCVLVHRLLHPETDLTARRVWEIVCAAI